MMREVRKPFKCRFYSIFLVLILSNHLLFLCKNQVYSAISTKLKIINVPQTN